MKNIAVIAAAGSGSRFGGRVPKQFVKVDGTELLALAARNFEGDRATGGVVIAAPPALLARTRALVKKNRLKKVLAVIAGGRERYLTVLNALNYIKKYSPENVFIHDAARPVFGKGLVKKLEMALKKYRAAIPVVAVASTVKKVKAGVITDTLDRNELGLAATPQAFRYADLFRLYTAASVKKLKPTDEAYMFERAGLKVAAVEEKSINIKVTTKEDLKVIRAIIV